MKRMMTGLAVLLAGAFSLSAEDGAFEPGRQLTVTLKPGDVKMTFCYIPPGTFTMGSQKSDPDRAADETPAHEVKITKGFWLGKHEVSQAQWKAVMETNPLAERHASEETHPVTYVSWKDCQAFVEKLNRMGETEFRLPTEAEWEYACRAGTKTRFFWGDETANVDSFAWIPGNSGGRLQTHPWGMKLPNPWGLHDTVGSVGEWCQDRYERYPAAPQTDPQGPSEGDARLYRGRYFTAQISSDPRAGVEYCRSAARAHSGEESRLRFVGLRVLLVHDDLVATADGAVIEVIDESEAYLNRVGERIIAAFRENSVELFRNSMANADVMKEVADSVVSETQERKDKFMEQELNFSLPPDILTASFADAWRWALDRKINWMEAKLQRVRMNVAVKVTEETTEIPGIRFKPGTKIWIADDILVEVVSGDDVYTVILDECLAANGKGWLLNSPVWLKEGTVDDWERENEAKGGAAKEEN